MAKRQHRKPSGDRVDSVGMAKRANEVARMASSAHPPTRQELAQRFNITPRAVSNLIDYAKSVGLELVTTARADGKRAYVLKGGTVLDRPMTVAEAIASLTLTEAVIGSPLAADRKATEESAHRFRGALRKDVDEQIARLKGRFAVRMLRAARPATDAVFSTVIEGILHNRVLAVDYESSARKRTSGTAVRSAGAPEARVGEAASAPRARGISTVEIEPYGIFFAKRSWYLVARKRGTNEMRMYKLARFRRVMGTEATFEIPRGWTVDDYMKHSWEIVREQTPQLQRVIVDIDQAFAPTVEETQWHPTQRTSTLPGGGVRFTFEVAGLSEILYWVLSMGAHATVHSPPELAAKVRDEVRAMYSKIASDSERATTR